MMANALFFLGAGAAILVGVANLTFHGIRKSSTEEKGDTL